MSLIDSRQSHDLLPGKTGADGRLSSRGHSAPEFGRNSVPSHRSSKPTSAPTRPVFSRGPSLGELQVDRRQGKAWVERWRGGGAATSTHWKVKWRIVTGHHVVFYQSKLMEGAFRRVSSWRWSSVSVHTVRSYAEQLSAERVTGWCWLN